MSEGLIPARAGTTRRPNRKYFFRGLIPARAGTTIFRPSAILGSRAHPRSRGDHVDNLPLIVVMPGSSPLARGPHGVSFPAPKGAGLIPARAGTTSWWPRRSLRRRAHPRSRGDHTTKKRTPQRNAGSSPLARGPRGRAKPAAHPPGLIPARAGTTSRYTRLRTSSRAHPRSRGDHHSMNYLHSLIWGSSPLARGPL